MSPQRLAEVTGKSPTHERATLRGFARYRVRGKPYPAITPEPGGVVEGVVYREIDESTWARLDAHEGELYARKLVQVTLADGQIAMAGAYVFRSEFWQLLTERGWDVDEFL